MKPQIFPIAIVLLASLSCSVTSANIFNEDEGRSLSGLRGRARKHNQKLVKTKSKQKDGMGEAGSKNNPVKKNQGRNKQKQQNKLRKNKPGKNKPGKKDKPQARPDERIIGGSQATPNANKFAVSLQDKIGHFCGGSLITRNAVLSAAHCQGTPYDVVLGRHNLNSKQGQTIRAKREVPHPKYRASTTDNDFMLVFLDQPATLNSRVGLISLNKDSNSPGVGNAVTVMGWGDTDIRDEVSTMSDVLMEVTVNVISNSQCDASSGSIGGYPENYKGQISQNMLCAKANKQDGCQGDSGGPLVEGNAQVGVVSWGIGCAHRDFPGVYARVSKAYDWIQREVCNDNKQYAEEAGFDCSGASGPSPSPPSGGGNYNPAPSPQSGGNSNSWDDDWSSYSGGDSGNNWDDDWSNYSGGGGGGNSNSWDDDWSSYSGGGSGGGNGNNWDDDWSSHYGGGGGGGSSNNWDDDWSNYSGSSGGGISNNWDDDWSSYSGGGGGGGSSNNWDDDWSNYSGSGGGGLSNNWDDDWSSYSGGGSGNNRDDDWWNYSGGGGGSVGNNWDDDWSSYSGGGSGEGNGNNRDDDWLNYSGGGNSNNWDDDWSSYSGGSSSNNWDDDWSSYSAGGNSYGGDDDWGDYH